MRSETGSPTSELRRPSRRAQTRSSFLLRSITRKDLVVQGGLTSNDQKTPPLTDEIHIVVLFTTFNGGVFTTRSGGPDPVAGGGRVPLRQTGQPVDDDLRAEAPGPYGADGSPSPGGDGALRHPPTASLEVNKLASVTKEAVETARQS